MEVLYQSVFLNYESTADLTMAEAGDILVITTSRDEDAIQPYIDWKREKGFKVFKEVVVTGTNVNHLYNSNIMPIPTYFTYSLLATGLISSAILEEAQMHLWM